MNPFNVIKRKANTFYSMIHPLANDKWDHFVISIDFLWCHYILKVPADEYFKYNFHNLKHRYRKNFVLVRDRDKFVNVNTAGFTVSKYAFYSHIPDLYHREILLAPHCGEETFVQFLRKHQKIVTKPDSGSLGKGLEVVQYTDDQAARNYFATITADHALICEEFIRQHPTLSQLNPSSVNTIRIFSLLQGDEVEIVAAILKTGLGINNITDNLSTGGIGAQIDVPTGIVCTFGKDYQFHTFTHHPYSGTPILGLQIPHWSQAVALIKTAHKRLPQCMLYGWDIAITETGVDIVEANGKPGPRIMQTMDGIPKGSKILPLIKKDRLKEKRAEYKQNFLAVCRSLGVIK